MLLNACGGGDSGGGSGGDSGGGVDSGGDSPTLTITPIPPTITTLPALRSTQKLEVLNDGTYQNMRIRRFGSAGVRYVGAHRKDLYGRVFVST